ncbi:MAG: hypothetical protein HYV07_00995 [Deltaproteobacteria bacterium]|nr:hypothetical protein [Deltaproteobacteria bacterium]
MCYLVHHLAEDQWTFAFWDGDRPMPVHVRRAYAKIKSTFHLGDLVRFRPDSNEQEAIARQVVDVPFVSNDELYKRSSYQPFNKGIGVGRLRVVPASASEAELSFEPEDVVILRGSLSDITPVAAIISERFSSPLSHVSLRAIGWRIPNVGMKDASSRFAPLVGKVVLVDAGPSTLVLREATEVEVAEHRARRAARGNLELSGLPRLEVLTREDFRTVGPKAANLGIIWRAKLPGVHVPPGFGVPFREYARHVAAAGIDRMIAELIKDPAVQRDAELRKRRLAELRERIVAASISPELCDRIGAALEGLPSDRGVFVRSSHNAEDLDAFSGAGLHDTVPNVRGKDAV